MNDRMPFVQPPVEDRATQAEWFLVYLAFAASAGTTGYLVYQAWEHIALISALLVSGVVTGVGFEVWNEFKLKSD